MGDSRRAEETLRIDGHGVSPVADLTLNTVLERMRQGWPLIAFGVLWADLVHHLGYMWSANEQYAYGWFVPFLSLGLYWRRWMIRPAARRAISSIWLKALVMGCLLVLLPARVIGDVNEDWPLCGWLLALPTVGLSLYALFLAGGLRWVKHFAFPICFILVAIPWPYRVEHGTTQVLMQILARLNVEFLGWCNIPALQHGNIIEVSAGMVGTDEACSGIRSFQSTLMAGLFLGELYGFRVRDRWLLLLGGVVQAFCFNMARTFVLVRRAATAGIAAFEKWHDPVGVIAVVMSFACLWGIALALRRISRVERPTTAPTPPPRTEGITAVHAGFFPRRYLLAVGCWSLLSIGFTELWYRSHHGDSAGSATWTFQMPESGRKFQQIEIAPRSIKLLAFDEGAAGKWQGESGSEWSAYFFRWRPRSVQSIIHSRLHRPDVCLPAAGLRQVSDGGVDFFEAGDLKLPFRKYVYESAGRRLYVFFCRWDEGASQQPGLEATTSLDRLQSVVEGRRQLGEQTLELILTGCDSLRLAEEEVRRELPHLIKLEPLTALTPGGA